MKEPTFENALVHSVWTIDIKIPLSSMNGALSTAFYRCSGSKLNTYKIHRFYPLKSYVKMQFFYCNFFPKNETKNNDRCPQTKLNLKWTKKRYCKTVISFQSSQCFLLCLGSLYFFFPQICLIQNKRVHRKQE